MASNKQAKELYEKYLNSTCTEEEKALVERSILHIFAVDTTIDHKTLVTRSDQIKKALEKKIGTRTISWASKWSYAAAAILLVAFATALYLNRTRTVPPDIGPGGNRATLILADGTKVALDSAQSGIIVNNEDIKYINGKKVEGTRLKEDGPGAPGVIVNRKSEFVNNVLSTPKGGQYQIVLSDGTKVWLNAQSTLKYPSRFSGDKREVELEGEAYFSVVVGNPFIVKSRNQETIVLGTEFNINTYDPVVKTTLVTGAIQVSGQEGNKITNSSTYKRLIPGQQAINTNGNLQVKKADLEVVTAWKSGKFMFDEEPIQQVMSSIARWYNIDIVYVGPTPTEKFGGSVSRFDQVSSVLSILELTGNVHFRIEGGKIYVSK